MERIVYTQSIFYIYLQLSLYRIRAFDKTEYTLKLFKSQAGPEIFLKTLAASFYLFFLSHKASIKQETLFFLLLISSLDPWRVARSEINLPLSVYTARE